MATEPVRKLSRDAHRRRIHLRVRTRVNGTPEHLVPLAPPPPVPEAKPYDPLAGTVIDPLTGATMPAPPEAISPEVTTVPPPPPPVA